MANKLKKIGILEFSKMIKDLKENDEFDFCGSVQDGVKELSEKHGVQWFSVRRMDFQDSDICLVGGYEQHTHCINMSENEAEFFDEAIAKFFDYEVLDFVYIVVKAEGK